jgi:hypothetical protein
MRALVEGHRGQGTGVCVDFDHIVQGPYSASKHGSDSYSTLVLDMDCFILGFIPQGFLLIKHALKPVQAKIYFPGNCMDFTRIRIRG